MYICNSYNLDTWDLPDIYIYIFLSSIFNQATKRDRRLLLEETHAVYNL